MGLFGSILGYIDSGRAGGAISDANIAAEHGVLQSTKDAQDAINRASGQGQAAVSGALDTAHADVGHATDWANESLGGAYNNANANYAPYRDAGVQGAQQLQQYAAGPDSKFNFKLDDYWNSPAYKQELQSGQDAIQNSMAASGLGNSGAAAKALTTFGQATGAKYYDQAFQEAKSAFDTNQSATLSNLSQLMGAGMFGAKGTSDAGLTTASQISNNDTGASKFLAGLDVQGNEFNSNTGMTAQDIAGKEGMLGSKEAGDYAVGAGTARAGGILGQGNNLASGVGDLATLAMMFM